MWWIVFAGFILWDFVLLKPSPHPEVGIPYSTFLAEVRDGNVNSVHIVGAAITGAFAKPVQWPPPTPTAALQSESHAPPSAKPAQPAAPAPKFTAFETTFPEAIGDSGLMPLLQSHHVEIEVSRTSTPWLFEVLIEWAPMLLLVGFFWWMSRNATRTQAGMFGFGHSKARRYSSDQPKVTFNDVAGADEAKAELQEEVDFLRNPKKYRDLGARIPRGILLVGPPGTGKTLWHERSLAKPEWNSSASMPLNLSRCS